MSSPARALRSDLGFRHIALVLSGGGALGAYEVGVLKVLERLALRPALIAGVSSGALNAVIWLAQDFRTAPLERVWLSLRASGIGMRWWTLAVRALGVMILAMAVLEVFLTLAGSPELGVPKLFGRPASALAPIESVALDALAWGAVGVVGIAIMVLSRHAEEWIARLTPILDPLRWHRWLGRALIAGAAIHATTLLAVLPWPHRFSATALLFGLLLWLTNRPGPAGSRMRGVLQRTMPETGGRGLWGSTARRRLLEQLVEEGDASRLFAGPVRLDIGALAVDSGRTCHFVNWRDPSPDFRARVEQSLGEVVELRDAKEVISAAVASSAMPGLFEPVRFSGRDFVDPGGFTNQPLHAALAEGADAVIVVLLSPSRSLPEGRPPGHLFALGGRLLEIANWRDMQAELHSLPDTWYELDPVARLCVVEPESVLPGGVLDFDPAHAAEHIRRGERDAWTALERAGWLVAANL